MVHKKVKYLLRFLLINRRGKKIVFNIFTPSRAPALLFILCIHVRKPKIEHQCVKKNVHLSEQKMDSKN